MDSTNLNTFPNISERGSSIDCINDELCCANILSAIGIEGDSNASKLISNLKEDIPCSRVCTVESVESCEAPHEIYLSDIKLESGHNEVASNADKISTNEAINSDISTSCTSHIKLEPANRRDADMDDNLGEFVRYVLNASKIPHKIFDNDYARRLRGVDQSDANVNDPKVKTDNTLSTHFDVPYTGEEVTKKSVVKAGNPTNIVCCPDIMGKIAQSHSKKSRKKIQQADGGQKSGNIGQSDANELGVTFVDVNSKVRRPPTPYKCEELNKCETSLPSSSPLSRTNPVEEFILPDILPDKLQPKIDGEILAPSSTKGFEFSPKFIPKPKNFKRGGAPTGMDPEAKRARRAEYMRKYRNHQRVKQTEEESSQRRALHAQQQRDIRQMKHRQETEEEASRRRALQAQRKRDIRQMQQQQESEEEASRRRALHAQKMRYIRQMQLQQETAEEASQRRALRAQRKRDIRQMQQKQETVEETSLRRALRAQQIRDIRQMQPQRETGEETNLRRILYAQQMRDFQQMQQQQETGEEASLRWTLHALQMPDVQQLQQQPETEEVSLRRILHDQQMRDIRQVQQQEIEEETSLPRVLQAQQMREIQIQTQQQLETEYEANLRRNLYAQQMPDIQQMQQQHETEEEASLRRTLHAQQKRDFRQMQQQQEQ